MGESILSKAGQWFRNTPIRSLEEAYSAACSIKALEEQHFNGQKIAPGIHSENVYRFLQTQLRQYLQTLDVRLNEFRVSNALSLTPVGKPSANGSNNSSTPILEKLQFIDGIRASYVGRPSSNPAQTSITKQPATTPLKPELNGYKKVKLAGKPKKPKHEESDVITSLYESEVFNDPESASNKSGLLPRSILRTANRLRKELSPDYEQSVVTEFRNSRNITIISVRLLLLLILIPFCLQILTKSVVFDPLITSIRGSDPAQILLTRDYEERAFRELRYFQDKIEFDRLLGRGSPETQGKREALLRAKAAELMERYSVSDSDGIKNILADLVSLFSFSAILYFRREDIDELKMFIDRIVYGLSDSAKAFIIILFTDVFVGYHSPHGWEVLLSVVARHFGLPENQELNFAFIATFPVFLDTLFKYWIFRYLNSISPSAVATYKNMNE